jgi:hypothetical protein
MPDDVDLYDGHYSQLAADLQSELASMEGEETFEGLQRFLQAVHTLARERRLSRYLYLASKPVSSGEPLNEAHREPPAV